MAKPSYDQSEMNTVFIYQSLSLSLVVESDQSCSSTSGDRTRTISGRSNNGQKKKREHETFDRQVIVF